MAAVMGLRIPALGFACFLTLFTTSQTKLIRGLTSLGMPYKAGLTLATALRYIPVFFSIFQSVSAAQRARGLDLSGKVKTARQETQRIRTLGGPVQIVSAHHHRGADPRLQNEPKRRLGYGIARAQPESKA